MYQGQFNKDNGTFGSTPYFGNGHSFVGRSNLIGNSGLANSSVNRWPEVTRGGGGYNSVRDEMPSKYQRVTCKDTEIKAEDRQVRFEQQRIPESSRFEQQRIPESSRFEQQRIPESSRFEQQRIPESSRFEQQRIPESSRFEQPGLGDRQFGDRINFENRDDWGAVGPRRPPNESDGYSGRNNLADQGLRRIETSYNHGLGRKNDHENWASAGRNPGDGWRMSGKSYLEDRGIPPRRNDIGESSIAGRSNFEDRKFTRGNDFRDPPLPGRNDFRDPAIQPQRSFGDRGMPRGNDFRDPPIPGRNDLRDPAIQPQRSFGDQGMPRGNDFRDPPIPGRNDFRNFGMQPKNEFEAWDFPRKSIASQDADMLMGRRHLGDSVIPQKIFTKDWGTERSYPSGMSFAGQDPVRLPVKREGYDFDDHWISKKAKKNSLERLFSKAAGSAILDSLRSPNAAPFNVGGGGEAPVQHAAPSEWGTQDVDLLHFIQANNVSFKGENIPQPIMSFNAIALPDFVRDAIIRENYVTPTPIQSLTWPIALAGRNMVGIAQTGSGKTLGFVLPAIVKILRKHQENPTLMRTSCEPQILVLAPTRELALQTQEVTAKFAANRIKSLCVYGGDSRKKQKNKLETDLDMVIATPGRLNDFLNAKCLSLQRCIYLVLDEADRMLDMGFEPQVRRIVSNINKDCQTLMFSATWPPDVKKLAEEFLGNYAQVNIGSISACPVANQSIKQIVEMCKEPEKTGRLFRIINELLIDKENKILVFVSSKKKVKRLEKAMKELGYPFVCIHGGKPQRDREKCLSAFSSGLSQIMVATDVASRGLDVNDIKYVVNYDFPNSTEDYVHRIGRTGRYGKTGTSLTFMTVKDAAYARQLITVLREAHQPVPDFLEVMAVNSKKEPEAFRKRNTTKEQKDWNTDSMKKLKKRIRGSKKKK